MILFLPRSVWSTGGSNGSDSFFGLDIIWFTMSVILVPILHVFSCEFTFISQRIEWMRRWHVLLRCSSTVLGHVTADAHARGKNCERMELAGCWPKHVWWLIREVNEEEGRQECANLFHTFTLTLCTMVVCRLKWIIFPLLLKKYSLSCLPFFFFWYLYSYLCGANREKLFSWICIVCVGVLGTWMLTSGDMFWSQKLKLTSSCFHS
jgi:hypothetical protein